jgi:hypothetical protein
MFRAQLALLANIQLVLVQLQPHILIAARVMCFAVLLQTCIITTKSAIVHVQVLHPSIRATQKLAIQAALLQILIYWEAFVIQAAALLHPNIHITPSAIALVLLLHRITWIMPTSATQAVLLIIHIYWEQFVIQIVHQPLPSIITIMDVTVLAQVVLLITQMAQKTAIPVALQAILIG